ncbi:MAG TPA: dihydroneopterin aldolase [Bacteroidales bacterium]|nr:dihydroneopterin aldolase [Bacteroidales bacterium]
MATIALEGMEFHAYHGCFAEEQVTGNTFFVDIYFDTDTSVAEDTDDLNETVNYAEVYEIIKAQMELKSKLLEHVGKRIIDAITKRFPEVETIELKVSKMNPPIGGKVDNVSVILNHPD